MVMVSGGELLVEKSETDVVPVSAPHRWVLVKSASANV